MIELREMWELFAFQMRLGCEEAVSTEAVLLHGRGDPIVDDMFVCAANLYHSGDIRQVVISGVTAAGARQQNVDFAGSEVWTQALLEKGILLGDINHLQLPDRFNAADESEAFLKLAREKGWVRLGIMAVPYHLPRCFLTMVAALKRRGYHPWFDVVALQSRILINWKETITRLRTVGTGREDEHGPRGEQILHEFQSLLQYQDPSSCRTPIATFAEALEYLRERDFRRSPRKA